MAARKEVSLDRVPGPKISVDENDASFRTEVVSTYDEQDPEFTHSWQRGDVNQTTLKRKGQEVVKDETGAEVRDSMGDILVRQDRQAFEDKLRLQQERSLQDVAAVVSNQTDDGDGISVDADLLQTANPKSVRKPVTGIKINRTG